MQIVKINRLKSGVKSTFNLAIFLTGMVGALTVMKIVPIALIAGDLQDYILISVWSIIYFGAVMWLLKD